MPASLTPLLLRSVLSLSLLAAPVFARLVRGVVTDGEDRPVSRAAVRVKNTARLKIRSVRTRKDGTYLMNGLDPRVDYEIRASHNRRSSGWVTLSQFDEGDVRVVNLQVK